MNRLRKLAFIGDIKKNDLDFIVTNAEIEAVLKNQDKALHENPQWNDAKLYSGDTENIVGFIDWTQEQEGQGVSIYISNFEVREEYSQTGVAMMILKKFKEVVLEPAIQQYDKDNVFLSADIINDKLNGTIERVLGKMGINFKDNGPVQVLKKLQESGLRNENNMVINEPLSKYQDFLQSTSNSYSMYDIVGFIDANGDVHYGNYSILDGRVDPTNGGILFSVIGEHLEIDGTIEQLNGINQSYIDNLATVFGNNIMVETADQFGREGNSYTLDELRNQTVQANVAKKQMKLAYELGDLDHNQVFQDFFKEYFIHFIAPHEGIDDLMKLEHSDETVEEFVYSISPNGIGSKYKEWEKEAYEAFKSEHDKFSY